MARLTVAENTYLTLVTLNDEAKMDVTTLLKTIADIDHAYMERFGSQGAATLFHAALIGPYDFAILYTGSSEAALYLAARIGERGIADTVTMPAVDLDQFTKMFGK